MFGIAYKPFNKKKEEYSMPKGAAFEDEAEFEKDMIISRVTKKIEEDDEFDIDVNNDYIPSNITPNDREKDVTIDLAEIKTTATATELAEKRAIDNATRAAREKEEEVLFMAAIKTENRLKFEENEKLKLKPGGKKIVDSDELNSTPTNTSKPSIRIAAKQSLDEIVGIYSNGLGDQEVLMLDVSTEDCHTPKGGNMIFKGVTTIDEGDEEAEEREELEEVSALAENVLQKMKLEAEWDSLTDTNVRDAIQTSSTDSDDKFTEITYAVAIYYLRYRLSNCNLSIAFRALPETAEVPSFLLIILFLYF